MQVVVPEQLAGLGTFTARSRSAGAVLAQRSLTFDIPTRPTRRW